MPKVATARERGTALDVARSLGGRIRDQLAGERAALVVAFASTTQPLSELLPALAGTLPGTPVLGVSTAGEFTEGEEGIGATTVFAVAGDYRVFGGMSTGLRADLEGTVARALAGIPVAVEGYPHRTAILLVDGLAGVGEEVTLLAAGALGVDVPIAGGMAADDGEMGQTLVGLGDRVAADGLVVAVIFSKELLGIGVCHGHVVGGSRSTVTRSVGSTVHEIDGQPAWQRWLEQVRPVALADGVDVDGAATPAEVFRLFAYYDVGVSTGKEFKIRTPLTRNADESLGFACGMPEGMEIELMRSTPDLQLEAAREAARRALAALGGRKAAGALVFECACRKVLLGDDFGAAPRAMSAELGGVKLAGFESYGEIALNVGDFSGFHNTTSVVLAFPGVKTVPGQAISRTDVIDLLAASVGTTKAEHAVRAAAGALRLEGTSFSLDLALALLEKIAEEPGIMGITARFAKSRAVLRWTP